MLTGARNEVAEHPVSIFLTVIPAVLTLITALAALEVANRAAEPIAPRIAEGVTPTATSSLNPQAGNTYDPGNLTDNVPTTAWVEGAADEGIGESVTFSLPGEFELDRVTISNGYSKDQARFLRNARVKGIELRTDDRTMTLTLEDTPSEQDLDRDFGTTTEVTLTINSVYPGKTVSGSGPFTDTVISDVELFGRPVEDGA